MPFIIKSASRGVVLLLCLLLPFASRLSAQVEQDVFTFSPKPEKDCKGKLMLQVDNLNFFQNNEFKTLIDGYSLPGLWIQPRLVFYPLENLKLEAGMHMLYYNGASHYPTGTYLEYTAVLPCASVQQEPNVPSDFGQPLRWLRPSSD